MTMTGMREKRGIKRKGGEKMRRIAITLLALMVGIVLSPISTYADPFANNHQSYTIIRSYTSEGVLNSQTQYLHQWGRSTTGELLKM